MGAMPEFMRRSELSFMGIRGKLLRRRCPLLSKNERYFSLRSLRDVHCIILNRTFQKDIIIDTPLYHYFSTVSSAYVGDNQNTSAIIVQMDKNNAAY